MEFDKWFEQQSLLVKVILLIIPFVGWVVELLVRISAVIRNASTNNIIGLVLGAVVPFWGWVDAIFILIQGKMLFLE